MSVTVVSCLYGDGYEEFLGEWLDSVFALDPAPDQMILATDRDLEITGVKVVVSECEWSYPQAWHLKDAVGYAGTDWVWFLDIDDRAMPDALKGLDKVAAGVWQMGFLRSDGEEYAPPAMTGPEFLRSTRNVFTAGSAVRVTDFWRCGGFPDVALQDWALWRRLAAAGVTFEASGRSHYHYRRHGGTRGETELTLDTRALHLAEMMASEENHALAV